MPPGASLSTASSPVEAGAPGQARRNRGRLELDGLGQAIGTRAGAAPLVGDETGTTRWRDRPGPVVSHALAVLWLFVAGMAYLAPTLARGTSLGDYELLSAFGFGSVPGTPLHNVVSSDQIQEMIPWTDLSWVQVHAGHLPLWNHFAGLGLPLAFNFQAASFSLPTAVSYLFPLHLAYTVTVVVKLLLAGTGVMFLLRAVGMRLVPATAAGTIFELSGAFTAWLGWPHDGVFCWFGWVLGAIVMVVKGRHPVRWAALMAVFVALSVLGGHPESIIISLVCGAVFALVLLVRRAYSQRAIGDAVRRGAALLGAVLGGMGLSAPVLLPSLQVIAGSSHTASTGYLPLPPTNVVNLATATFYGLPILHHPYFGSRNYYEAASYVGLGAMCLAAVAVVCCWRRAEVMAMAAVGLGCAALVYSSTVAKVVGSAPGLKLILWDRAVIPLDLVLAALAGVGFQTLIDRRGERLVRNTFAVAATLGAVLVASLWAATATSHFRGGQAVQEERLHSLIVPGVAAAAGLVGVGLVLGRRRAGRHARAASGVHARTAVALVAVAELAFLLTATPDLWSSSAHGFVTTAAERAYQQAVGPARVGFFKCPSLVQQPNLGILAEANSAYAVSELAAYDPVVPKAWFHAWGAATGQPGVIGINNFCASVDSVGLAREFGVGYVLVPAGSPAPSGAVLATTIQGVGVWRVPGAGLVTAGRPGAALEAAGTPLPYTWAAPNRLQATVDAAGTRSVHFHISDMPGWHATVDGRPVAVRSWARAMLAVTVGPGRHRIVLTYEPAAWTWGLWIALVTAAALLAAAAGWDRLGRRVRELRRPAK